MPNDPASYIKDLVPFKITNMEIAILIIVGNRFINRGKGISIDSICEKINEKKLACSNIHGVLSRMVEKGLLKKFSLAETAKIPEFREYYESLTEDAQNHEVYFLTERGKLLFPVIEHKYFD